MKKTKTLVSLLLSLIVCLSLASCSDSNSGSMADESKSSLADSSSTASIAESTDSASEDESSDEHDHDKNADFVLHVEAVPSETEKGIINAVITLSHVKEELSAIQFELTYSSNTVEGVYTTNDEMIKTMTVVPTYETTAGVSLPRFEQICLYKKDSSMYRCMYVDLLSYPSAVEGQTFTGMKNDGEMVITIPFKVNTDASAGNVVKFDLIEGSIKGTKTQGLVATKGDGTSATYTLAETDIVK